MFLKPISIKSQTQLKGSDKKKLKNEVLEAFPSVDADVVFPNKVGITLIKGYTQKGDGIHIYQVKDEPFFFTIDKEKTLYPTVYLLWIYPSLINVFTTQDAVIPKLTQGADLMLPGVILNEEVGPSSYGKFEKGALFGVITTENIAPVAVGLTAHSSFDLYMANRRGKALSVLHVIGDHLWMLGSKSMAPQLEGKIEQVDSDEPPHIDMLDSLEVMNLEKDVALPEEIVKPEGPDYMNELLVHCFLKALKTTAKKVDLPILSSNFYRVHMIPSCPDGQTLDVKKSTYKKLSKFLSEMQNRGIIKLVEYPKGVENITEVDYSHEDLINFVVDKSETTYAPTPGGGNNTFVPPTMEEVYQVSGTTIQFFKLNRLDKGEVLTRTEVRDVVRNYITAKKLQNKDLVELDSVLHDAIIAPKKGYKEHLRWDEIFSRVLGKMAPAIRITRPGLPPLIQKGKLKAIEMVVAKRMGNKKVTLIYNLSTFGIDEEEFCHQVQVGVATSTSVGPAENKPQGTIQVLVQGNHVAFIGKLLTETYTIPKKYIRGLELAIKKKKK